MSNEIPRKPEMAKANPHNEIKLLFCIKVVQEHEEYLNKLCRIQI